MRIRGQRRAVVAAVAALLAAVLTAVPGVVAPVPAGAAVAQSGSTVSGTVRDAVSGAAVPSAHVAALRSADFSLADSTVAAADGTYALDGLSAGTYYLYLIDPAGGHAAGFHGAPTPVAVTGTGAVPTDPTMAPTRGRVVGTVTEDGSGLPLEGAWIGMLSATTGGLVAGAVTDATGAYAVDGLTAGPHLIVTIDPLAAHRPEFHDDRPGPGGAAVVAVVAGATTTVDTALTAIEPASADHPITGTVTDERTDDPVAGAWVVALDAATMTLAGGARTAADGTYTLLVPAGRHLLEFVDPTGAHAMEWYDDQDLAGLADATAVEVDGPVQVDEALAPTLGSLSGTVAEDESDDPVPAAWALAIGNSGVRATTTAPNGSFRVDGLAPGTYRAAVVDAAGGRGLEYWDGSGDYAGASPITVAAGADTHVTASLPPLRCGHPAAPAVCLPAFPLPAPGAGWSKYTIPAGAHPATVTQGAQATTPLAGLTTRAARRFHFLFDSTATYVLTNPTQPEDQFDWNKLPGLSDCPSAIPGFPNTDLSQNGWMFGWRWRTDLTPRVLEITAYANNNGVHLTPPTPLVTLTASQLAAGVPLWFELDLSADRQRYEFRVAGPGSRSATASLPRVCPTYSTTALRWASGFYFGGTSTAPNVITGWINEP